MKRNKLKEELNIFKKALSYIKKVAGKDKCRGYAVGCPNCETQILIGCLHNHIDLLEWELKYEKK